MPRRVESQEQKELKLAEAIRENSEFMLHLVHRKILRALAMRRSEVHATRLQCHIASLEHRAKLREERLRQRITKRRDPQSARHVLKRDDDKAVRTALPRWLVPVFNNLRLKIKNSSRRSRTEAFLEWTAAHPEEVVSVQWAAADKAMRELFKHERALSRQVEGKGQYKRSAGELFKLLGSLP